MKWTAILLAVLAMLVTTAWCAGLVAVLGAQNKDLAAWSQAVGSLFAVGAAIWAAHHSTQAQDRAAKRAWRDQVGGVLEATLLAADSWRDIDAAIDEKDAVRALTIYWTLDGADWRPIKRFLEMPIDRWPSAELFARVSTFDRALDKYSFALAQFDRAPNRMYPHQADWTPIYDVRTPYREAFMKVVETANSLLKR